MMKLILASVAMVTLLAGCGKVIHGRVIEGTSPLVMSVPGTDERLSESGVTGVRVVAKNARGTELARATSSADGTFKLSFSGKPSGSLRFEAESDGYIGARSNVYIPADSEKLLVVLRSSAKSLLKQTEAEADAGP